MDFQPAASYKAFPAPLRHLFTVLIPDIPARVRQPHTRQKEMG